MVFIPRIFGSRLPRAIASSIVASVLASLPVAAQPEQAGSESAASLQSRRAQLKDRLATSVFGRPLVIESSESSNLVDGNVDAVLSAPYATVSATFRNPTRWCDVMMLHLNTKSCQSTGNSAPSTLKVHIGRKTAQQLQDAFELDFDFRVRSATPELLSVVATAPKGPLGTTDYRLEIQAVPLDANRTFLRLRYSYGYGVASRVAMRGYLATAGSGKVGFTTVPSGSGNSLVGGMRGAVERNTMRYYLAIEAYLSALSQPSGDQADARLQLWFDATEQYPRQLREITKTDYLTMKKSELARQKTLPAIN